MKDCKEIKHQINNLIILKKLKAQKIACPRQTKKTSDHGEGLLLIVRNSSMMDFFPWSKIYFTQGQSNNTKKDYCSLD